MRLLSGRLEEMGSQRRLHHLVGGRAGPSARLLARALAKLGDAPARLDGVDVASARLGAERILAALRQGEAVDPRSVVLS